MKLIVLLSMSFILAGCASTKINESGVCYTQLEAGDKLLIPFLPKESSEFDLRQIERIMQSKKVDVKYLPRKNGT